VEERPVVEPAEAYPRVAVQEMQVSEVWVVVVEAMYLPEAQLVQGKGSKTDLNFPLGQMAHSELPD